MTSDCSHTHLAFRVYAGDPKEECNYDCLSARYTFAVFEGSDGIHVFSKLENHHLKSQPCTFSVLSAKDITLDKQTTQSHINDRRK